MTEDPSGIHSRHSRDTAWHAGSLLTLDPAAGTSTCASHIEWKPLWRQSRAPGA